MAATMMPMDITTIAIPTIKRIGQLVGALACTAFAATVMGSMTIPLSKKNDEYFRWQLPYSRYLELAVLGQGHSQIT